MRTKPETKVKLSRQNKQKLAQTREREYPEVQTDKTHLRKSTQAGVDGEARSQRKGMRAHCPVKLVLVKTFGD